MKYLFLLILFSGQAIAQTTMMQPQRNNSFNPAIGINAMMLATKSEIDTEEDGASLQGVELQFNADVDAYFRAQVVIGIHKEAHEEDESAEEEGHDEFAIHAEEVYVETISIPSITFKAGKFLSQFGKYNSLHLHAQPFIYRSVVQQSMFGDEGFAAQGVGASFLVPLGWFSEITLETSSPKNEELFEETGHATAYVGKLKNLWDLGETTTIEWGVSGLNYVRDAYNDNDEQTTTLIGTDFTIKWRPLEKSRTKSLTWSTEFIQKERTGDIDFENGGVTSFIQAQFDTRWYLQYQYEYLGIDRSEDSDFAHVNTALIGYVPSEFSALRAQYDHVASDDDEVEKRISLQLNFSIGAHPAHMY